VGFDEDRGDVITLKSMDLPSIEPQGTVVTSSFMDNIYLDAMSLIQMAALAIVSLILGLFVIKPILTNSAAGVGAAADGGDELPALPPLGGGDFMANPDLGMALNGEIENNETGQFEPLGGMGGMGGMGGGGLPALGGGSDDNPVDRLREMIGERQEETVEILRGWLEESEEKA
jgi:flagellar M-ring protein FliF